MAQAEEGTIHAPWLAAHAVTTAARLGDGLSSAERPTLLGSTKLDGLTPRPERQLFVDVSTIVRHDDQTGVQRVIRSLLRELYRNPPAGQRIEPVYLTNEGGRWRYRYARFWVARLFNDPLAWPHDEPIAWSAGDSLLIVDLTGVFAIEAARDGLYQRLKADGVQLNLIVYDLLPMQMPEYVAPIGFVFPDWLIALAGVVDGVICISQAVVEDMRTWLRAVMPHRLQDLRLEWFHLGSDLAASTPSRGLPIGFEANLRVIASGPCFLMVGTIEPRKGHLQVLDAFDRLWAKGSDAILLVIGRAGWRGLREEHRRNIPQIEARLRGHALLGRRLIWFDDASDELLERVYALKPCLIAASEGEGFGLPLIEAARHRLPIIARDMPVFREVAGQYAHYFSGLSSRALAKAIEEWLALNAAGKAPSSQHMPWLTWAESARTLVAILERWSPTPPTAAEADPEGAEDGAEGFVQHSSCSARDFFTRPFLRICRTLDMQPKFHRKLWEFCYIFNRLERNGFLRTGYKGLGFGVGAEPMPSAFAARGVRVTATDAPPEIGFAAGWAEANQFAAAKDSLYRPSLLTRSEFDRNVEFQPCDMNNIDPALTGFDFCWSACSLEHLGSLSNGLDFIRNSVEKTLRIGGLACHTTELNLSDDDQTVETGPTVLYRKRDILAFLAEMRQRGHQVETFRLAEDSHLLDKHIDLPPYRQIAHLKTQLGAFVTTSVGVAIRRGV